MTKKTIGNIALARKLKCEGLTYCEIGTKLGFTRSYAQQLLRIPGDRKGICQKCGRPSNKLHGHHSSYTSNSGTFLCVTCHRLEHSKIRIVVDELRKTPAGITVDFEKFKKMGISRHMFLYACKSAGVKASPLPHQQKQHPRWRVINWSLPNKQLSSIWDINENYISRQRHKRNMPRPKWRFQFDPDEFLSLLRDEKLKAATIG